ncbi:CAP domain-containing protein [Nocardioides sp. J54]|uniref:CAP domain-containing protein n=1 Tax=Nocardioides sp. J54 TaxID=935866 RepID=UPI000A04591D|nr:CAP domain-containing protein [Nocardioides sp. J54]
MNRGILRLVAVTMLFLAVAVAPSTTPVATAAGTPTTSVVIRSAKLQLTVRALLENDVVARTNAQRERAGCRPLRKNRELRVAARRHSKRMAAANTMSHRLPGEPTLGRRITRAGYLRWTRVAENVAAGFSTPSTTTRAWWGSPSHRRNLTDCSLREIGVGVVFNGVRMFWTQNFGRRR